MGLVTRITQAETLTRRKQSGLERLAAKLAAVRAYVWRKYGSLAGVGMSPYAIRDAVCSRFKHLDIASHVLQGTILDAAANIAANREAAKVEVVRAIFRHTSGKDERKRLCTALKLDAARNGYASWTEDRYLCRQMRKRCRRGHSRCANQIVLPCDCYEWFSLRGRGFVSINTFVGPKHHVVRVAIPLRTDRKIEGGIRIILRDDVEVHYGIDASDARPCGTATIGVDKGYTEVLVDSDGESHGVGLGDMLSAESDCLKKKYVARNRIRAIAAKSAPDKRARMEAHNLGRSKLRRRKHRHRQIVSALVHRAVHSVVSKAGTIAVEDLTKPFASKDRGANMNRRLSGWAKGEIASALDDVASRRSASVKLVNAAYTSQICCTCGCFGRRSGDKFYCEVCGAVGRSDHVAARNVLARLNDTEIKLHTPYKTVKEILLRRSLPRLRLSNQDSSCAAVASTESESRVFSRVGVEKKT